MSKSNVAEGEIQVSCQQTRFHVLEDNGSNDIDVQGLNIVIATPPVNGQDTSSTFKSTRRKASRMYGKELLSGAHLKFKAGRHYGFVGRNGTGKSTVLRALATGLIPGIFNHIRIASLVQTAEHESNDNTASERSTVLEAVIHGDPYRNRLVNELNILTDGMNSSDPLAALQALRRVQHARLLRQFQEVEKMVKLRSGTRGSEARKLLVEFEKKVAESSDRLHQTNMEMDHDTAARETQEAAELQAECELALDTGGLHLNDVEAKARRILKGLGFHKGQYQQEVTSLSGGWMMRTLLATALTQASDVLILDEPTNFLDISGVLWLEQYLEALDPDKTVIIVSHDRAFMNNACSELVILRDCQLTYFAGNLDSYDESVKTEILRTTRMKEAQERQVEHMSQTIADSKKQGLRTGDDSKLRQAKSRQKKLDERMGVEVNAKGGRFKLSRDLAGWHENKRDAIEIPKQEREVTMTLPPSAELKVTGSLISLEGVWFKYPGAPTSTLRDINLVIHPVSRIGIVGLNGAGKSTLVKLLVDAWKPTTGNSSRHPRLKVGYFSQNAVDALKEEQKSAVAVLSAVDPEADPYKLLGSLGLRDFDTPANKLSGGQAARLALAQVIQDPPHLLILDEPTTHLDLPAVQALGDALEAWDGAIVLVTHDRAFMRGFSENVFEVKDGKITAKDVDVWENGLKQSIGLV